MENINFENTLKCDKMFFILSKSGGACRIIPQEAIIGSIEMMLRGLFVFIHTTSLILIQS